MKSLLKAIKEFFTRPWVYHGRETLTQLFLGRPYFVKGELTLFTFRRKASMSEVILMLREGLYKNNMVKWWWRDRRPLKHLLITDDESINDLFKHEPLPKNHYTSKRDVIFCEPEDEYYLSRMLRTILWQCTRSDCQVSTVMINTWYKSIDRNEFSDFLRALRQLAIKHNFTVLVFRSANIINYNKKGNFSDGILEQQADNSLTVDFTDSATNPAITLFKYKARPTRFVYETIIDLSLLMKQ